jgi:hypothetical protein
VTSHVALPPTRTRVKFGASPAAARRLFPDRDAYARLRRVNVRAYDTGVVFLHYEPQHGA